MPKFTKPDTRPKTPAPLGAQLPVITEKRCSVCTSPHRASIDKMLVISTPYTEIQRVFGIDRRSVSNHDKKHLNINDAAVREIVRKKAEEAQENVEQGVSSKVNRRAYMEIAVQKSMEQILDGTLLITPKEAVAIIEKMDRDDELDSAVAVDELYRQFNAFMSALRELVDPDVQHQVFARTKEILGGDTIDAVEVQELPASIDAIATRNKP